MSMIQTAPEPPKIKVRRSARRRWSAAEAARRVGPGQTLERLKLSRLTIEGDLDLRGVDLHGELELDDVVLRGRLRLDEARLRQGLSLRGTCIEGGIQLDHARIDGDLCIAALAVGAELRGRGLIVGGELLARGLRALEVSATNGAEALTGLDLRGCEVRGGVELHGIELPGDLILDDARLGGWTDLSGLKARRLGLRGLRLDSGFELHAAQLRRGISAGELRAATDISLRDSELDADLDLRRAVICGRLDLVRLEARAVRLGSARLNSGALASELSCVELSAPGAEVGAAIELRSARVSGAIRLQDLRGQDLDLGDARIGGDLQLSKAELGTLRLEGAVIGGVIELDDAELAHLAADRLSCRGDARLVKTVILGGIDARDAIFDRRLSLRPRTLFGTLRLSGTRAAHPDLDREALAFSIEWSHDPDREGALDEARATVGVLAAWLESQNDYVGMDAMRLYGHALRRRRRRGLLGRLLSLLEFWLVAVPTGYGLRPGRVAVSLIALGLGVAELSRRNPAEFGRAGLQLSEAASIGLGTMAGRALGPAPLAESAFALGLPVASLVGVLLTALLVGSLTRVLAR